MLEVVWVITRVTRCQNPEVLSKRNQ